MSLDNRHHIYMRLALKQAQQAFDKDEVPVGAVIVDPRGNVIARAHNKVESKNTQVAHAEILALMKAGAKLGGWRLEGCFIYVTLEPCMMCLHSIIMSRMAGIVYGAKSPLFGYHLDKYGGLSIYKNKRLPIKVVAGICSQEAEVVLKEFFRKKRIGSEWYKNGSGGSQESG